jgi:acetoin utilization protein AcuC
MGDTPAFKGCYEISSLIVGGSILACEQVMNGTLTHAFNPAGGLHHAHPERASGFCIFNDPAVVIAYLKSKYNLRRIVYLDIDAHHGDGVMYGYYSDPALLDIDFHEDGRYLFPGTGFVDEIGTGQGKGLKINIPLPPLTGDEAFLEAFNRVVPKFVREYKPEMILVQCGADGHENDRLAHLRYTTKTYNEVISQMHRLAHELCNGRMLLYGGGGYTVANVPRVWTIAFAALANITLENRLPELWRKNFHSNLDEEAPQSLLDTPTTDETGTKKQVNNIVTELFTELA